MKPLRLASLFRVLAFVVGMNALAALACTGLATAQGVPAQKPQTHFAKSVAYNAGGAEPGSVAIADLNGDGKMDLVIVDYCQSADDIGYCTETSGEVAVLVGNGDGTFQPAVTYGTGALYAKSVAVADVNGDGAPDLIVANLCLNADSCGGVGGLSVLLGNGDGTFQSAVTYNTGAYDTYSVAVADLQGNGILDLIAASIYDPNETYYGAVSVLLGNGDGTFQSAVVYTTGGGDAGSVAIADLNGDGIPDVVAANACQDGCGGGGSAAVLLGNGDGTFQPAVTYNANAGFTYSVAVGDLRSNGIFDLVVASWAENGSARPNALGVMLGNGDGTFQPVVSYLAAGAAMDAVTIGDVNGDGIPDLAVVDECQNVRREACIGTGEVSVLLGNGDGTFQAPVGYGSADYQASAIAIGDLNGDDRPDIVATNLCQETCETGTVAVLLNETSYTTKTALTSSPNPALVNQTVTFTATITSTPSVPNGEVVTFYDGKTELGTGATANGVATLSTSFAKAKSYTIKASYSGDAFRKASSGTVKQVVN